MANTSSAKKATRKIARRTIVNKSRRTQMRGAVRTVEEAIKRGDRDAALKAMASAEPELMQAAQRNIIHKNNASRKVSRLAHQIAKLQNELIEKEIRQKAWPAPGFSFLSSYCTPGYGARNSCASVFYCLMSESRLKKFTTAATN